MYNAHFGLSEPPFSIAPDPRYLYMSERHREALAHLLYGVESDGGFVLLTGEVGTGKTTVCRCLLEQLPEHCNVAFILNPKLSVPELLSTICDEFHIAYPAGADSVKVFTDLINAYLLDAHAKGRKPVLIIDEAQNLSGDVLEQMRLLTNLETNQRKLLQIILLGQPELRDMLARPELRQLAQRIIARFHLNALSREETDAYVKHRLAVAGVRGELFPQRVLNKLHRLSSGIPRLINVLCDRTLLGAYVQGKTAVDRKTLVKAAREVFGADETKPAHPAYWIKWLLGLLLLVAAGATAYSFYQRELHVAVKTTLQFQHAPSFIPAPTTDLSWPARQPVEFSEVLAYQTIFRLWGAAWLPTNQESPCAQAEAQGLRCLAERGGLDTLRRLDRPAVLKLYDQKGGAYYAALTRIKENSVNLVLGTDARTVALEALALSWHGEFTLLWRLPPGYRDTIHPGSREPAVAWLDKLLAQHFQRSPQTASRGYDALMVEEVKRFQLANGLQPDGVVGPGTLIGLENVAASGIPLLREKP